MIHAASFKRCRVCKNISVTLRSVRWKKRALLKVLFRQCFYNSAVSAISEVLFFFVKEDQCTKQQPHNKHYVWLQHATCKYVSIRDTLLIMGRPLFCLQQTSWSELCDTDCAGSSHRKMGTLWWSINGWTWSAFAQEVEHVIYKLGGWWFDPRLLQFACQISLGKILTPSCSLMHLLEYEC